MDAYEMVILDLEEKRRTIDRAIELVESLRPQKVCIIDISRAPTFIEAFSNPAPLNGTMSHSQLD